MTAGRLRRLVGVLAIVGTLDGLRDADSNERIGFKGGSALELRFGSRPGPRRISMPRTAASPRRRWTLISSALESGWNNFTSIVTDQGEITREMT